ncbi:peptidylprolyl isomerase [Thermaurantiacus sp.]
MLARRLVLLIGLLMAAPLAAKDPPPPPPAKPDINDPENLLLLDLSTGGRVTIFLRPDVAPAHVERVKTLARRGFYDGIIFHRVIDGFMAQTGDPTGTGQGGSDLPDLKAEFNNLPHMRGAVSMARTEEPDSANSQFFIVFEPTLRLDRQYTVFGRVIDGMKWVDAIPRGEPPANPARILQASVAADRKPLPAFPEAARAPDQSLLDAEAAKLGLPPPRN